MSSIYPAGPAAIPENLTKPTGAYKRHAWFAVIGLAVFVLLYVALSGWFVWTAYRLLSGAFQGEGGAFLGVLSALPAIFLSIFMLKALFVVKRGQETDDIEVTAEQQPKLFEFLHRLADESRAPRPHRVFLSARVNAAVFYDLSLLNLFFPSKKNLEIGLGLVNVLTVGEFKAVLAHEFGHFAQRSMAVGRWVYIAQQIAAHIIAERDALDRLLQSISRFDLRIAWVGWLLSLIVWSIRSLMETIFIFVVIAQRALSREMEFQADLVAVSLTGSDALVHALHKLNAADEAWERAINFAGTESQQGRAIPDIFSAQTRIIQKLSVIRDDPLFGKAPELPVENREAHRVFKAMLAHPPRMWATHPESSLREDNAKRIYVPAEIDERSAWEIFANSQSIKEQMSAHLVRSMELEKASLDECLTRLDKQFSRTYLLRCFRGAYLGRSVVRHARTVDALYDKSVPPDTILNELGTLYPESLANDLELLRGLEEEKYLLEGIQNRVFKATGNVILHRGEELRRNELPQAIKEVDSEINEVHERITAHDQKCRTVHMAIAQIQRSGWPEFLRGLASILHYADHTEANLRDAHGYLANVLAVITADRHVSANELKRLLRVSNEVYHVLATVFEQAEKVVLDDGLKKKLEVDNWQQMLGEWKLPPPDQQNINEWIRVIDGWLESVAGALSAIKYAALEQLLMTETQLARSYREHKAMLDSAIASQVPDQYSVLVPGEERKRQTKLDWWDRFQTADGFFPGALRFLVAVLIVGALLGLGSLAGGASITIYNGLAQAVVVDIGGQTTKVKPYSFASVSKEPSDHYVVRTSTSAGELIETFDATVKGSYANYVYNVANASPLVEWTAVYGNARQRPERYLGAPRWVSTDADVLFKTPPDSVSTKGGGATRDVLTGFGAESPEYAFSLIKSEEEKVRLIDAHARWDGSDSKYLVYWLSYASQGKNFVDVLSTRLANHPNDVVTLRLQQDTAVDDAAKQNICESHRTIAAEKPKDINLKYIVARCIDDEASRDQAFLNGYTQWPEHAWFSMAAGYTMASHEQWNDALTALDQARKALPVTASLVAADIARLRRVAANSMSVSFNDIANDADLIPYILAIESGDGIEGSVLTAYHELYMGNLSSALHQSSTYKDEYPRVLRLVAASDGADNTIVKEALSLGAEQGLDQHTVWPAMALAMRMKKDYQLYKKRALELDAKNAEKIIAFLEMVSQDDNFESAVSKLDGLLPVYRGRAYSAASVLLGKQCPNKWRAMAKQLLFGHERPYLI